MSDEGRDELTGADAVRGEAHRLTRRLESARERLDAALAPRAPLPARPPRGAEREATSGPGAGRARIDDVDDDEVLPLLTPAVDRIARLAEAARALADASLTEEAAERAVREIRDTQPSRRPR